MALVSYLKIVLVQVNPCRLVMVVELGHGMTVRFGVVWKRSLHFHISFFQPEKELFRKESFEHIFIENNEFKIEIL